MNLRKLTLILPLLTCSTVLAQRDPPMIECYLPSITVRHADNKRLSLELLLKKETGPHEHVEHQMSLLAYMKDDEQQIMEIVADPNLLDKHKDPKEKLFLEELLDRGLVVEVGSQVAKRGGFAGQDNAGRYADGSKAGQSRERFLRLNTFPFEFAPTYNEIFAKVSELKHFKNEDRPAGQIGIYQTRFKLLAFVPVNDCRYATNVQESVRGKTDFAVGEYLQPKTPILYFRPLPYEFVFRRDDRVGTSVYIR